MPLFDVPTRATKEDDLAIAKKSKKKTATTVKSGGGILDRIELIRKSVNQNLGKYKDAHLVIRGDNEDVLVDYINTAISNKVIAIDTETTGLNPLSDKLVGICIYTPGKKPAYIPVNHISYITRQKVANQLSVEVLKEQFDRLKGIDIIMFNSTFDIRFLRHGIGVYLNCTWDCYIAARLMNENEPVNKLKPLHNKYCLNGAGDAFTFDELFNGVTFDIIPIDIAQLYAAHDPFITYELYEFQKKYLYYDETCTPDARNGMNGVAWVFFNIEMPLVEVVADMEDTGVLFDKDYNQELKVKYHTLLDGYESDFHKKCEKYSDAIRRYEMENPGILDNPINIKSTKQLAILMFDIMKLDPPLDKKTKKPIISTKESVLDELKDNEVVQSIIDYREFSTIVSTFIDKLPDCVQADGRIHCKFNQYGADTGRFSSNDPNMQNIPSHNKDIRKMFIASPGYLLMSSDFSQQEPTCLAALCKKKGDSQMYDTFMAGRDLYSEIASKAFNVPYENCREFNEDGSKNKEGKERRTQAKSILLGVLYGRGVASISEQLFGMPKTDSERDEFANKAQQIKDSVFRGFPAIKQFEEDSLDMAHEIGYVTTVCGRKRRLPALQLPEYEFKWLSGKCPYDDPLDFSMTDSLPVPLDRKAYYWDKLHKARFKSKPIIFEEARKEGIDIIDNNKKIADATRQCVNSRIQGSAADLTKLAMIGLHNNARLKELGFRMLIPVHDEIIAECPEENIKECSELLAKTMSEAAETILEMPIKCDVEIKKQWYDETIDGNAIKPKETNTSHGMDVDKLRGVS